MDMIFLLCTPAAAGGKTINRAAKMLQLDFYHLLHRSPCIIMANGNGEIEDNVDLWNIGETN